MSVQAEETQIYTHAQVSVCAFKHVHIHTHLSQFWYQSTHPPYQPPQKRNMPQRSKICNVTQPLTCNNSVFLACTAAFFLRKLKCLYPGWQRKYKWNRKASTLLYCQMHIIFLSGEIFLQICCKELPARLVYDVASSTSISFDEDGDASFLSYSSAPYKPVTIFVMLIKHKPAQLFLFFLFFNSKQLTSNFCVRSLQRKLCAVSTVIIVQIPSVITHISLL